MKNKVWKRVAIKASTELSATKGKIAIGNGCLINRKRMIVVDEKIEMGEGTMIISNARIYDRDGNGWYPNGSLIKRRIRI